MVRPWRTDPWRTRAPREWSVGRGIHASARAVGQGHGVGAGSPPVHAGAPAGRGISNVGVRVTPHARGPGRPSPRGRTPGGGSDHALRGTHCQTHRPWPYGPPTTCSRSAAAGGVRARLWQTPLFAGSNVPGARCCLRRISDASVLKVAGTRANPQDEPLLANLGSGTVWTQHREGSLADPCPRGCPRESQRPGPSTPADRFQTSPALRFVETGREGAGRALGRSASGTGHDSANDTRSTPAFRVSRGKVAREPPGLTETRAGLQLAASSASGTRQRSSLDDGEPGAERPRGARPGYPAWVSAGGVRSEEVGGRRSGEGQSRPRSTAAPSRVAPPRSTCPSRQTQRGPGHSLRAGGCSVRVTVPRAFNPRRSGRVTLGGRSGSSASVRVTGPWAPHPPHLRPGHPQRGRMTPVGPLHAPGRAVRSSVWPRASGVRRPAPGR